MNPSNPSVCILSIGSDTKLFIEGSAVRERAKEYGKLFKEMHIVVFSFKKSGLAPARIADNVWAYPTNSPSKLFYVNDAIDEGMRIAKEKGLAAASSVITTQDPFESGIVGAFLKSKLGIPLHVQLHTDLFDRYFTAESLLNKLRARIAPFVLRRADAVRVVSEKIKAKVCAAYGVPESKVAVLPIFVDVGAIAEAPRLWSLQERYPGFECIGLMASRITREKRIDLALEAFAKAFKENPSIGLVIAGEGPEKERLTARAQALGIHKNVIFEGWQQDLVPYFKAADFFLLTSAFEGYGMTLVEAAAAGLPIISTDVGIASELIEDGVNSFVCHASDVDCIAERIIQLGSDKELRKTFAEKMQARAAGFVRTKGEYVRDYRASIESALAKPSEAN